MRGEEAVGGPVTPLGLSAAPAAANKGGFWLFWDFFLRGWRVGGVGVGGVWGSKQFSKVQDGKLNCNRAD